MNQCSDKQLTKKPIVILDRYLSQKHIISPYFLVEFMKNTKDNSLTDIKHHFCNNKVIPKELLKIWPFSAWCAVCS